MELDDQFCTDEVYNFKQTESRTVETQTLESGPLPSTPSSKPGFDYYSLSYEDLSDWDWTSEEVTVFSPS